MLVSCLETVKTVYNAQAIKKSSINFTKRFVVILQNDVASWNNLIT